MSEEERLPATERGSSSNSGLVKKIGIGIVVFLSIYIAYSLFQNGKNEAPVKSDAEKQLEAIKKKQGQKVDAATSMQKSQATTEAPQGDPEANKLLSEVQAKKEAEARAMAEAEEMAQMAIEELNYQRKIQVLPHDAALAAAWENRMRQAQATGQAINRRDLSADELKALAAKNPALFAKLQSVKGTGPSVAGKPTGVASLLPGKPGATGAPGASVAVPGSINPKTGLPTSAGELQGGLLPDGTPDLDGGAYPVQVTYVPVGSKDPVTVTRWVRPGYLTGRTRPYSPQEVIEADKQWRTSMRASSEVESDKNTNSIAIPYRATSNRARVTNNDFQFVQRYVAVQPNPKGKLRPANPPVISGE